MADTMQKSSTEKSDYVKEIEVHKIILAINTNAANDSLTVTII